MSLAVVVTSVQRATVNCRSHGVVLRRQEAEATAEGVGRQPPRVRLLAGPRLTVGALPARQLQRRRYVDLLAGLFSDLGIHAALAGVVSDLGIPAALTGVVSDLGIHAALAGVVSDLGIHAALAGLFSDLGIHAALAGVIWSSAFTQRWLV